MPLLGAWYDRYFRCVTEFDADLGDGAMLVVGNHNGVYGMPDIFCHMVAFWRMWGPERRAHGLAHDLAFQTPVMRSWLSAVGALRATPQNAEGALAQGGVVLVFPGGELEACRPRRRRHRIDLAGRTGFVRTAIRAGVPIVPLVSAGGHDSLHVLADGRWLARALRFDELFRVETFPHGLAFPWGPWVGPLPHVPLPVKIHTRVLRPISFDLAPSAADDAATVDAIYHQIVERMQSALDELMRLGDHGLFPKRRRGRR